MITEDTITEIPPPFEIKSIAPQFIPIKEAWKQRIKKFQKIEFFIFMKNALTFGTFRKARTPKPITMIKNKMPKPASAIGSKL